MTREIVERRKRKRIVEGRKHMRCVVVGRRNNIELQFTFIISVFYISYVFYISTCGTW